MSPEELAAASGLAELCNIPRIFGSDNHYESCDNHEATTSDNNATDEESSSRVCKAPQQQPKSNKHHRRASKNNKSKVQFLVEPTVIQMVKTPRNVINHSYRDFSRVPPSKEDAVSDNDEDEDISEKSFPQKIHHILSQEEYSHCISWMPHGRAFRVHSPNLFEKQVALKYFGHTRYSSFLRQLANHGFKHITQGLDRNSYYHECMLRGLPHLCKYMPKLKKNARREIPDPEHEPDFYKIQELYPLPTEKVLKEKKERQQEQQQQQQVVHMDVVSPVKIITASPNPTLEAWEAAAPPPAPGLVSPTQSEENSSNNNVSQELQEKLLLALLTSQLQETTSSSSSNNHQNPQVHLTDFLSQSGLLTNPQNSQQINTAKEFLSQSGFVTGFVVPSSADNNTVIPSAPQLTQRQAEERNFSSPTFMNQIQPQQSNKSSNSSVDDPASVLQNLLVNLLGGASGDLWNQQQQQQQPQLQQLMPAPPTKTNVVPFTTHDLTQQLSSSLLAPPLDTTNNNQNSEINLSALLAMISQASGNQSAPFSAPAPVVTATPSWLSPADTSYNSRPQQQQMGAMDNNNIVASLYAALLQQTQN